METAYQNIHQDLIDRCKAEERQAQYELYRLYSKAMYNICYRMTNDMAEAEDILQEAFISAFRNIGSYNGTATFGAWLKRIVINKTITAINKRKIEWTSMEPVAEEQLQEETSAPETSEIDEVRQAVQALPDGYRVVFTLYALEGYDHQEIAQILGVSESTSKSQYNRSKKKLREILEKGVVYEG